MKYFFFCCLMISVVGFSAVGQRGSLHVYYYTKDINDIILKKGGSEWRLSPYKKDSAKVPVRTVATPDTITIFRLNKKVGFDTLKTSSGEKLGIVSFKKKSWLNLTLDDGTIYSFDKVNGNQWRYQLNGNTVLSCQLKKVDRVQTLEFMSRDDSLKGLEALLVLSQIYGVDRIEAKRQTGVMWGVALGLALTNLMINSASQ